jgi:hypothetical protein
MCIGRVLDDVWTTVVAIGMCIEHRVDNSRQLRSSTGTGVGGKTGGVSHLGKPGPHVPSLLRLRTRWYTAHDAGRPFLLELQNHF